VNAWDILYYTTDAVGAQDLATGAVIVPTAAWSGSGTRPVIDYAVGTQGLAQSCAPSAQLAAGTEYETANIVALLKQGWAVVLTDYQGYTTGSQSLYTVGAAEGHAVLDAVRAADQVPGVGLSSSTKTAIWGYSQGGQAAAWAGQLQQSYDPSLDLVGVAAGGIPANLQETANYLNGNVAAGFAAMSIIGLSDQYPSDINLAALENANGAAAVATIKSQCVFQTLLGFENVNIDQYTQGGQTLAQLEANPSIASAIDAQQLGTSAIPVPVYQYHGQADEIVPLDQDIALKQQYCSEGVTDEFALYPGEHITTQFQAAPAVISWISGRLGLLGSLTAPNDCVELNPPPTSTANPGGGDFVVSLNAWPLKASVSLKKLGSTLTLPSTSTFSGATDLTSQQLQNGTISVPAFSSSITALGILPLGLKVQLVQQGPATGSASLDTSGNLHIHGSVAETIDLPTISIFGINLVSATCQTSTPVTFPLDFDGPVSSLGDGQLSFSGSTTLPSLKSCGWLTGILNALFAGPGNSYTFTVSPPAPTAY
jgi:Secretory lipase